MSIGAKLFSLAVRAAGVKKKYSLPEDQFLAEVRKMNRTRGFYMPRDTKAVYSERDVLGSRCLVVQLSETPAERAILYFYGGGMLIGPDKGDVDVLVKLARRTGCDVWFPNYPLCTEHCITDAYDVAFECYRLMLGIYGAGNVSTCGFSSGGALALGVAAHNNATGAGLPMPRHIVAVSPGEVPWNDAERALMQANNPSDAMVDYAFMEKVERLERHGRDDVPDYMIHISKGDFTGVRDVHLVYSTSEVLYGAKANFLAAFARNGVACTVRERPGMIHAYAMLPYFHEAREDFAELADYLAR